MNKPLILDSSFVLSLFASEKNSRTARLIYQKIEEQRLEVYAPTLLLLEVTNVLLKKKHSPQDIVEEVVSFLQAGQIQFVNTTPVRVKQLIPLVITHNLSAYDAFYLALAQEKNALLITEDAALLKIPEYTRSSHAILAGL